MTRVLVVRPSSLGDVVYALAIVADIRRHLPDATIDWVAEETFAPLVELDPRIGRVIPVALRRWRGAAFARASWRELAAFRNALRQVKYDVVLNMQEQFKGALIARAARGTRHGFDRHSIREPVSTWFDDVHHRIARDQHFVDKCRALAAAALDYQIDGPATWQFDLSTPAPAMPPGPYALVFHATSRPDKLWPEASWRALLARFAAAGLTTLLPWGSEGEAARSARLAQDAAAVIVPPRQSLAQLAALAHRAQIVVGVDTGLTHLAAALGTATVAIFAATDPALAGVARVGAHAVDVGDTTGPPSLDAVAAAAGDLLRTGPRC